jgi:antitoxin MazE
MRLRIQKWGNSLVLRIPRPFTGEAQVKQGSVVDLPLVEGKLVAAPLARERWTLARLPAGVTQKNLPAEVDFGPPVGREAR